MNANMNEIETYLLSLHDLCQPVGIIFRRKRGKVHFLLLQSLIVQPQSKYTKQPVDISQVSTEIVLTHNKGWCCLPGRRIHCVNDT